MKTSQAEAFTGNAAGKLDQRLTVLGAIQDRVGISTRELAENLGLPLSTISARITELAQEGLIVQVRDRKVDGRTYACYQYEPDETEQAANRSHYQDSLFERDVNRLLTRHAHRVSGQVQDLLRRTITKEVVAA